MELVVAQVSGLKGFLDNWLKGLSPLTLLGSTNALHIIKSFLELLLEAAIRLPLQPSCKTLSPCLVALLDIPADVIRGTARTKTREKSSRDSSLLENISGPLSSSIFNARLGEAAKGVRSKAI